MATACTILTSQQFDTDGHGEFPTSFHNLVLDFFHFLGLILGFFPPLLVLGFFHLGLIFGYFTLGQFGYFTLGQLEFARVHGCS